MSTEPTGQLDLFDQAPARRIPATTGAPEIPANALTAHLIRTGHLTETGLTRAARHRTCTTCRQPTIAGLDADRLAFETHCDPHPLTPLGEALAHLDNRHTHNLARDAGRYVLEPRDHHQITAHPAQSTPREDVLRQHRCHTPPPSPPETTSSCFLPPEHTRLPANAPAPF